METQDPAQLPRTFSVRTLGCQMNLHDSERMAGLLQGMGLVPVDQVPEAVLRATEAGDGGADVVVINTCSVRENAANRLFGNLGQLAAVKRERPGMQIAVGGCLAQQLRDGIVQRAPWVDAVFGTHNIDVLPALLNRARHNSEAAVEIEESLKVFPSTLPSARESAYAAWVSISVGCNNTCTFCIVPRLRGRERDRLPEEIIDEVSAVVSEGAIEVTLLGQNVNSYGASFHDRKAFASLLRRVGQVEGLERLRFTSPHPASFTDDVIAAMAETPTVMPSLHMPLQSGSDKVLKDMRRSYRRSRFEGILDRVRAAIPDAAITTDIIVGFPGETDEDFEQTLEVVEQSRFASAFTFQYSPRPGTPAASRTDFIPDDVMAERYTRLVDLQNRISTEENQAQVGRELEVLVSEGEGRKDGHTRRLSGRARDNRLVHFAVPEGGDEPRPGDMVRVRATYGAPHHLLADSAIESRTLGNGPDGSREAGNGAIDGRLVGGTGTNAGPARSAAINVGSGESSPAGASAQESGGLYSVRRTRAGDAWEAGRAGNDHDDSRVALGIPALRVGPPA